MSDRYILELAEARTLYTSYVLQQQSVLTDKRIKFLEKIYGKGSVERIREYMNQLKSGVLE